MIEQKKKLHLEDLQVNSFVTSTFPVKSVLGGSIDGCNPSTVTMPRGDCSFLGTCTPEMCCGTGSEVLVTANACSKNLDCSFGCSEFLACNNSSAIQPCAC